MNTPFDTSGRGVNRLPVRAAENQHAAVAQQRGWVREWR